MDTVIKKSIHASEADSPRVISERQKFSKEIKSCPPRRVWVLDETALSTNMTRRYGRSPKNERCVGSAPGAWSTTTLLGAMNLNKDIVPLAFEGSMNSKIFELYLEKELLPQMHPGDILVMDNLSSHKTARVKELCLKHGITIKYLPPYSPDFNPIEKLWSKIKQLIRGLNPRTPEELDEATVRAGLLIASRSRTSGVGMSAQDTL